MVILLIIAVYLAIGMEIGFAMYKRESLDDKSEEYNTLALVILSLLWLIALIFGWYIDIKEKLEKKSKEDEA